MLLPKIPSWIWMESYYFFLFTGCFMYIANEKTLVETYLWYFHSNIVFAFCHVNIVFMQYHGMNVSLVIRCNHMIFYIWPNILLNSRDFVIKFTFFHIIFFSEICSHVVKNTHWYLFLCKGIKVSPWKTFS